MSTSPQHHSRVLVADLRPRSPAATTTGPATSLVAQLRRASAEFTALWDSGDVAVRRGERKRINHPALGVLDINRQNLFSEDGRQRLQFFTAPPGSPAVEQLRLLAVVDLQDLAAAPVPDR
ncbi:hypothetical protein [Actinoplanes subtropicus]|uniref:MmyB family transcriptional regulator n=1 Tax=Actinoplanes subtropicus TaxID=543632 RepID=UPI000A927571|nr:hypothetical protein [Actinoplanes subtropicus]